MTIFIMQNDSDEPEAESLNSSSDSGKGAAPTDINLVMPVSQDSLGHMMMKSQMITPVAIHVTETSPSPLLHFEFTFTS